eukprot:Nk52_evm1s2083 gene=Nk52_evmTU1s2083
MLESPTAFLQHVCEREKFLHPNAKRKILAWDFEIDGIPGKDPNFPVSEGGTSKKEKPKGNGQTTPPPTPSSTESKKPYEFIIISPPPPSPLHRRIMI